MQDRLHEITCPTLVPVGEQDPSTPPAVAAKLAASIKEAELVIVPDASHIVTVEAPAAVNAQLLRFLDRLRP